MAIVGYVLLGILAAVLLLLCVPVRLILRYCTGKAPVGVLRWLFFQVDLLKAAERKTADTETRAKKAEKLQPKKEKKPLEFSRTLGIAADLLSSLKGGAGMIVRRFRIYRLRLSMIVAGGDAAETAVDYGKCNAAVYSAYALAKNFLNLKNPEIEIRPDFVSEKGSVDFEMRGRLMPIIVLAAAARIFAAFLVKTIHRKKLQQE
ncbi:DUF2953 domain-containing protein [Marasmitruncus massiliensis]|uniref:DUF2953 domain-containing protein n=1 Tax=Marasmitruncus massiliensis TaxID=1944642 RepID=UPI000C799531|nr:DUF2953 domain-containing protein [Marasmitruncus massiliensis]